MTSRMHWAAIAIAVIALSRAHSQDHPFTVKDDIAMTRFSDPLSDHSVAGSESVRRSPDGKHFALVTTKGLLDSNQIQSDISVFDIEEISAFLNNAKREPPKPRVIATVISFPHREEANAYVAVIKDLRWSPDSTSVYFKGENPTGAYQLYVAKLDVSEFHAITPAGNSVGRFDVANNLLVYTASLPSEDHIARGDSINSDAQVITGHSLLDVLFPGQLTTIEPQTFTMSVLRSNDGEWSTRKLPNYSVREIPYLSFLFPFALSPEGNKLLTLTPIPTIPDLWRDYEPASGFEHMRFKVGDPHSTSPTLFLRPQQYSLIDLTTGTTVPLVSGPNARVLGYTDNNRLAWAGDGTRVLVTNTFLQLDARVGSDSAVRNRLPCAVASVDLPSLNARCLFFEESASKPDATHIRDVSFGENNDEALILVKRGTKDRAIQRYHLHDSEWRLISSSPISASTDTIADLDGPSGPQRKGLQVFIRQGLNDPPTLWVSNLDTGQARQLWDPNPQFGHVRFGNASGYHWKDKTGYEWSGVLIRPVDYVAGKRYPCVLQMYDFVQDEFITDGLYPTAFAARHLASAGLVVLQIRRKPTVLSEADPQNALEGYRSAVESLSDVGLIDRSKVGVVGFSWTCWYVVNALIKEPKLFSAATIADGLDNSYMQYLLTVDDPDLQAQMERIRGTSPFGVGLRRWIDQAPGFNLEQVQTPVRIEAMNPMSVLQEWELYSSLRSQNKAVDMIYFTQGTHIHQKPLERLESQQGDVDWFRFWLQSYIDPDPAKRAQFERWRKINDQLHPRPSIATDN
jgi:hypothetical protein